MSSDAFIVALCDKSSSTEARVLSLSCSLTPPTRSAAFSWLASQRAACDEATAFEFSIQDWEYLLYC